MWNEKVSGVHVDFL